MRLSRSSCLIDEGDTFLLTGGSVSKKTVARYNKHGFVEDLDDLITGRSSHGCSQYRRNKDGKNVPT